MGVSARAAAGLGVPVRRLDVAAYTIPTDEPEADGTLSWDSTTIVVVHARGGDHFGLGYTYADSSSAKLIDGQLRDAVEGSDAMSPARGVGADASGGSQPRSTRPLLRRTGRAAVRRGVQRRPAPVSRQPAPGVRARPAARMRRQAGSAAGLKARYGR